MLCQDLTQYSTLVKNIAWFGSKDWFAVISPLNNMLRLVFDKIARLSGHGLGATPDSTTMLIVPFNSSLTLLYFLSNGQSGN